MSSTPQLSTGVCKRLYEEVDNETLWTTRNTLQVLSVKKANVSSNANSAPDRYRVVLSDGVHFVQAMLATQLNHLIESDDSALKKFTVVAVTHLSCSVVQGRRLVIVLDLETLQDWNEKIGSPEPAENAPTQSESASNLPTGNNTTSSGGNLVSPHSAAQVAHTSRTQQPSSRNPIYPIEGLSPYQNKWTIKARVTQKSDIRTYSNQRGEGKLFNVTLVDESSEIRATAWNSLVDKLYDRLQEGKVYFISRARVNLAKKKFSNVANEYELMMEEGTEIEECHETVGVPINKYTFVELGKLEEITPGATCDVIGIVKDVGPTGEITSKASSKKITKRELTLVDRSNFSIRLTLWGKQAETWTANDQPVVAFKGVKVGDFGGRSLSMFSTSSFAINPDIPEAHGLRGWYDASGNTQSFQAHSSVGAAGAGGGGGFNRNETKTLFAVKEEQLGINERPDYFNARATVLHIKGDNLSYPGCPSEGCSKKVTDMGGEWRCEKCERSFESPDHRYMLSMTVSDHTGSLWLTGFNDVGLAVFGMSASELQDIKERDDVKFNDILQRACIQTFNFVARAKQDTFNDKTRVRYSITRLQKPDWREESNHLITLLNSDWAK